jgi:hypothetical protein
MSEADVQPAVTMSAEEIGAMSPEQAAARHTEIMRSPAWREKYLAGDTGARKEFALIHEKMAPIKTDGDRARLNDHLATAIQGFAGISDAVVQQLREGRAVSQEERQLAVHAKQRIMSSPESVRAYLDGNADLRQQMTLINAILSSPTKGT